MYYLGDTMVKEKILILFLFLGANYINGMHLMQRDKQKVNMSLMILERAIERKNEILIRIALKEYTNNAIQMEEMISLLVDKGESIVNGDGKTLFSLAIEENILKKINKYDDYQSLVNIRNKEGNALLHMAVREKKEKTVDALLELGAHINVIDQDGVSPLSLAIQNKDFALVKKLLKFKANPNLTNRIGWTPTHMAAYICDEEIFKEIINRGGDINRGICDTPIKPDEWIDVMSKALFKKLFKNQDIYIYPDPTNLTERIQKPNFIDIKILLINFLMHQGLAIEVNDGSEFRLPYEWFDLAETGAALEDIELDQSLIKVFADYLIELKPFEEYVSLNEWYIKLHLGCKLVAQIRAEIRPLLFLALTATKDVVYKELEYSLREWTELVCGNNNHDIFEALKIIVNEKEHFSARSIFSHFADKKSTKALARRIKPISHLKHEQRKSIRELLKNNSHKTLLEKLKAWTPTHFEYCHEIEEAFEKYKEKKLFPEPQKSVQLNQKSHAPIIASGSYSSSALEHMRRKKIQKNYHRERDSSPGT